MTQAGTHAAADFITDPEQLKKLAGLAPKNWPEKNIQFVLQTKVVNNIPTSPTLVATKTWLQQHKRKNPRSLLTGSSFSLILSR